MITPLESQLNVQTQIFTDIVGTWSVSSAEPPKDLSHLIAQIWESGGPVTVDHMKLIPRGTVDLIVNLGAHQTMYPEGQLHKARVFKNAWISGLFEQPLYVGPDLRNSPVSNHLIAISFFPSAVLPVFGVPANELVNRVFDADLLLGTSILTLQEQIAECESIENRFLLILDYVQKLHLRLARPAPFSALWAVDRLQLSSGFERIDNLCSELRISRRQLHRQFLNVTGISPKAYGRLVRFRAAANFLDKQQPCHLTQLAHNFGYSDQAHFSREFKYFTGDSPTQYLNSIGADGETIFIN